MDPASQSMIVTTHDLVHPLGKRFWLDDEMFPLDKHGMHDPRFSVQEVAKAFFGQGAEWLRWRMRPEKPSRKTGKSNHPEGFFILDGKPLEFKRLKVPEGSPKHGDPNASTARYYTLADVERMAHALGQQGVIDGQQVANIVLMTRICATLHGIDLLPEIHRKPEVTDD